MAVTDAAILLIVFSSVDDNDETRFLSPVIIINRNDTFLIAQEKFCTDVSLGWFVLNGDNFQHQFCIDFSVAKFSDDVHNCWFSNPCCGPQFTRRGAAFIQNHHINPVCGLSIIAAVADGLLCGLLPLFFPPLLK
jgi:hypothetical protein